MTDNKTINETSIQEIVDIPLGGKKNVVLDSQILSTLMSCPRLSDFRFNHNFVAISGKSNSLEVGSVVHKFLEVYYGSIIKGLSKSQSEGFGFAAAELYIQGCKHCTDFVPIHDSLYTNTEPPVISHICGPTCILKPKCGHEVNEYEGIRNTPKDSEGYKVGWQHALDTCKQYLEHYRNDFWVPLEVETVKGKVLYEDESLRILWKAKFDWIVDTNEDIVSVDHKTMKQNRTSLDLNNQFMGQCLVLGTKRMFKNKIGFQKSLKPEEKFIRELIYYNPERLLEWQSEILPYYANLLLMYAETGYYPPNYQSCESMYGPCSFSEVCRATPNFREEVLRREFKVGPVWNPTNPED